MMTSLGRIVRRFGLRRVALIAMSATSLTLGACTLPDEPGPLTDRYIVQITASNGTPLRMLIVYPPDFDSTMTYPMMMAFARGPQTFEYASELLDKWLDTDSSSAGWIIIAPIAPGGLPFHDESSIFLEDLFDFIDLAYHPEGGKIHIGGMEAGGISAFRTALDFPAKVASLVVWPGKPEDATDFNRLNLLTGIPVRMWAGENDVWLADIQAAHAKLEDLGIDSELTVIPDTGDTHLLPSVKAADIFNWLNGLR
jgi:pimeloyl-ACP methyl ester carboxylesterase